MITTHAQFWFFRKLSGNSFSTSFYVWFFKNPVDTGRKLNAHKTFRRHPERLLNVLCTFNFRLRGSHINDTNYSLMVNVRPFARIISCISLPYVPTAPLLHNVFTEQRFIFAFFFFCYVAFYGMIICCSKFPMSVSPLTRLSTCLIIIFFWWPVVLIGKITSATIACIHECFLVFW